MICIINIPAIEISVLLDKNIVEIKFSILYSNSSWNPLPSTRYSTCTSSIVSEPFEICTSKPYACNL